MSEPTATIADISPRGTVAGHARLIGVITVISRILGLLRETVAARFFGAGAIWSAFTVAFTIPNLFRKLFGEGALSSAFIPLYAQAHRRGPGHEPNAFANASVNLLALILLALSLIGEAVLCGLLLIPGLRDDYVLTIKLTMVMLPYVLLVCSTALLSGILQVHHRFAAPAATSIISNVCLIIAILISARFVDLGTRAGQTTAVWWLSIAVLVSGLLQVAMLMPSLGRAGFRFEPVLHVWTPQVREMLRMTLPVAMSLVVLQISVLLDKGISLTLAGDAGQSHFELLGATIRYPMATGAAARLTWAQFLYQFPLGVFAISLATAMFPRLSSDAADADLTRFRSVLRQGIEAALLIGLPASAGLIIVRYPAVRLMFERGAFTSYDTVLVARSTAFYAAAIWAFSLQQILNRAYYALRDPITPLVWAVVNLALNLLVELPLIWTGLGEAGMAAGTMVAFGVQAMAMVFMLDRKTGGMGLRQSLWPVAKMLAATLIMSAACLAVQYVPGYPMGSGTMALVAQLAILSGVGGGVYFVSCRAMGLNVLGRTRLR
jgi:putative peptidoglycan lipid II flippase